MPETCHPPALTAFPARPDAHALALRVEALVAHFGWVQRERMEGLPFLNLALSVQAVGFEWAATSEDPSAAVAEGVLLTPWFMSLVRLPFQRLPHYNQVGRKFIRDFGCERFDFIGGHDPAIGYHETCALFSPMEGFDTQARAVDTAQETLALVRPQPVAAAPVPVAPPAQAVPSRRAFFTLGRGSASGASR